MKIYTKTGDAGETGLFAGPRVRKDNPRIEAYGTVDELNAILGLARCQQVPLDARLQPGRLSTACGNLPPEIDALLTGIQHTLFDLGAELATPDPKSRGTNLVTPAQIESLESAIDRYEAGLPPLKTFILPGGTPGAAWLHLARTVCRRAERRVVTLAEHDGAQVSPQLIVYLNRLGDLLFVLARAVNHLAGQGDVPWQKDSRT